MDGRHPVLLLTSPFAEEETGLQGGWATCLESQERVSGLTGLSCSCCALNAALAPGTRETHLARTPAWPQRGLRREGNLASSLLLQPGPIPTLTPSPPPSPGICLPGFTRLFPVSP